ncbi:lantibiotic immunity ABC transporter MutE/EpiE family permease subunit [Clostridium sp.]|jgi:ABC-2 type transport system permease protein|uniref:lantibiotic immunity ABC transporter MutE/EpiE family permease subunit n=1 Tax=Clostridium sp. TaxID=1506 RepID=UPI00258D2E2B|nr:lantibiotic immunity ABC transporter MutE/EpiE family permease subunit [Clostridium sp.]MDF2505547.1 lantibiotic protection transporter permease subunit, MutE/EpiE family [Clostridium sp.]
MIGIIQAEYIKYKRTFMKGLMILAPLFFVILALPQKLFMPDNYLRPWQILIDLVYNWWPVIFIPIGIALFAVLVNSQEKRAGNYRAIRSHDVSPGSIWVGKIVVMAIHTLFATFILIFAVLISGVITANGNIPWFKIFIGAFIVWLTSLAIIPLQLWIVSWKGTFASIILGILGSIVGVVAASKAYWIYVPWSWPVRLMCPIIGVHPNGVPLESNSLLLDSSVIVIGIIVSLSAFIIFTFLTAIWFERREIR